MLQRKRIGLALSAVTLAQLVLACGYLKKNSGKKDAAALNDDALATQLSYQPQLAQYGSCQEIQDEYNNFMQRLYERQHEIMIRNQQDQPGLPWQPANRSSQSEPVADNVSAQENSSVTNVQEQGIDEADAVKISDSQIFYVHGSDVEVIERKDRSLTGRISFGSVIPKALYVAGNRLIVIDTNDYRNTKVSSYKLEAGKLPVLEKDYQSQGRLLSSRLYEGHLYLAFHADISLQQPANPYQPIPQSPIVSAEDEPMAQPKYRPQLRLDSRPTSNGPSKITIEGDKLFGVPCQRITKNHMIDGDLSFTKLVTLTTDGSLAEKDAIGVHGTSQILYMSENHIVLSKIGLPYHMMYWSEENDAQAAQIARLSQQTFLTSVSFAKNGALQATAFGAVDGYLKDQWSVSELGKDQLLAVATTTNGNRGVAVPVMAEAGLASPVNEVKAGDGQNHLFILKQNGDRLETVAAVKGLGKELETIKSVRFVGDYAYVVTFRTTDPLFAINLQDPYAPKISAELEIPGFSTYLHPLKDGRLLGIGVAAQQNKLQTSLFKHESDSLSQIDNVTFGSFSSSSPAQYDHHEFWFNSERQWFTFPVSINSKDVFSGSILLAIEQDRLVEKARFSHQDLMGQGRDSCGRNIWAPSSVRSFILDDQMITLSSAGMRSYALSDFKTVAKELKFGVSNNEFCNGPGRIIE